jgi:glycosyltransferase involved in cell wall biosynthesis
MTTTTVSNIEGGARPTVSVGMPVYNGERFVGEAIESILRQTYDDWELVICDNASTDSTPEICRAYARRDPRVRFYRMCRNFGAARNFNRTIELSRGRYFRWHAHDDLIAPTFLEKCVEVLDNHPEVVLVYPRRQYITLDGRPMRSADFWNDEDTDKSLHDVDFARLLRLHSSYYVVMEFGLTRIDQLNRTGRMGAYCTADAVLLPELRFLGRFYEIPETLFFQRVHDEAEYAPRLTKRGEAIFMNPDHQPLLILPGLKIYWELSKSIAAAPLQTHERWQAYRDLCAHLWPRAKRLMRLSALAGKVRQAWKWSHPSEPIGQMRTN